MVDFSSRRGITVEAGFTFHGVDGTATLPGESPVAAVPVRVIWYPPATELSPGGLTFRGVESRRTVGIRRSELPDCPTNTIIVAPDGPGGVTKTWRVDGAADPQAEHHRVFVIEVP